MIKIIWLKKQFLLAVRALEMICESPFDDILQCDNLYDRHVQLRVRMVSDGWSYLKKHAYELIGDIAEFAKFAVKTRRDIFVAFCAGA